MRLGLSIAAGLVGFGLVVYGSWLIYQPAAFIVAGFCLWRGAVRLAKEKEDARKVR